MIFSLWPTIADVYGSLNGEFAAKLDVDQVTMAGHPSTDLPPNTLKSILRQAGLETKSLLLLM
jgi:hypothetical protein